ncbi:MAG: hypothetical protein IJ714_10475, partial [Bacteroidales bacterium]|nr:hypothetical protein [Bacteroidales bacterium]
LDLTILSFIFVTMLYNATNIRNIIDKKKTLEGLLSKKSQNQTVKLPRRAISFMFSEISLKGRQNLAKEKNLKLVVSLYDVPKK